MGFTSFYSKRLPETYLILFLLIENGMSDMLCVPTCHVTWHPTNDFAKDIVGWWADWWALGARTRPQGICSQHQSHTSVRLPCHFISQDLIYLLSQCGPWNNSLNLFFPATSMITKSLKLCHRAESVYVHTPLKIKGWNPKINQLKRKIIWTKMNQTSNFEFHLHFRRVYPASTDIT